MRIICTILFFFIIVNLQAQKTYFFDATLGDDTRSSVQAQSQATPWRSLTKFNSFFTSFNAGDHASFKRGETFLGQMTISKSGLSGNHIVIDDYGSGARPIISGFVTAGSWVSIGSGRYESVIASAGSTLNMVTRDGSFQAIGRWPKLIAANSGYLTFQSSSGTSSITSNAISGALSYVGGELVIRSSHYYLNRGTISNQTSTTVTYSPLPTPFPTYDPINNSGFFFQNHPNACTVLGDWSYTASTKKLTMYFGAANPNTFVIKGSVIDDLVTISGNSYITFNNIQFEGSNANAFRLSSATNISITNCDIIHHGVNGITPSGTSSNNVVSNCTLAYVNNNGMNATSSPGWTVSYNNIHDIAFIAGMGVGGDGQYNGLFGFSTGSVIDHNSVRRIGYVGIFFDGSNVTVSNNFVDSFCMVKSDGGGIYSGNAGSGRIIRNNIVINGIGAGNGTVDGQYSASGIYVDDNGSGYDIYGNTVANCALTGFLFHNTNNINLHDNTAYNNEVHTAPLAAQILINDDGSAGAVSNMTIQNNKFISRASDQFVACITDNATGIPGFGTFNNNYYARPIDDNKVFHIFENNYSTEFDLTLSEWKAFSGQDGNSQKSPKTITDLNDLVFYYNETTSNKVISLNGTYIDVANVAYIGSITLLPYTSAVLIFQSGGGVQPLNVSASYTTISCNGNLSTITATVTGGVTPYSYVLDGGSPQAGNTWSNKAAGSHTITVTDQQGTVASTTFTITQPTAISISESHTAITVNGNTSTVTITASGGTGAKQYKIGSGSYQSSNVFSGVIAGTYTVTVRDANLCTNTITFTITQPSVLVVGSSVTTAITCNGGNGVITVTASGGTPPYTNTGAFTRAAGTWSFTVTDAGGASATTTTTITQPSAIVITESHTAIAINGGTSTVTITASGGTGTLNYKIGSGSYQVSNVFSGVVAGTYTVTVRDASLCTNTITFTITQPTVVALGLASSAITCNGGTSTITATGSGGTTPYQYKLGSGSYQASGTFSGNAAGTYNVTLLDAGGATISNSITITQPSAIVISESHTAIAVNGGTSTVTITASGGTGTLNYKIGSGSYQASNIFSGVVAGTYTVTVRDASLCTNTITFTITQPSALIVSAAVTTAIACNGGTATATVTASGGTPSYQYKVGAGSYQASNIFSGLLAGTYTFTVLDAGGAIVSSSPLTITQPAVITVSSAYGTAPATVTVTAGGGVGTLNYSIDIGSYQASNVFNAVAAGNHIITVRDANLCTATQTINVPAAGTPLSVLATPTNATCNGANGSVTVSGSGGTPPYTGTGVFARAAGTWSFTVTDNAGATASTTVTVTQPAPVGVAISYSPIAANGGSTTVTFTGSGGVPAYTYSLDGSAYQAGAFAGVLAGNHTVIVKDANTCTSTQLFTITQPGLLYITATPTAITCYGGNSTVTISGSGGTAPITVVGGSPQSKAAGTWTFSVTDAFGTQKDTIITITQPAAIAIAAPSYAAIAVNGGSTTVTITASAGVPAYTYNLDAGGYQGSNVFAGVLAGNHTITVKDANNCTSTLLFTITQPGLVYISVSPTAITCYGGNSTVTITGSGGTAPITVTGGSPQTKTAGTYTFSVVDALGAQHDSIVTITQPSQISISVTTGTILTNGGNTTVTATASGGTGALTYKIDAGSYQGTGSFSGITAGTHTVTVKDASNCTNTNTFSITQPGALYISATPTVSSFVCYNDVTTVTVVGSGGTAPITYGKNGTFQGSGTFSNVSAGTYTFSVKDVFNAQHDTLLTITQPTQIQIAQITPLSVLTNGGTNAWTYVLATGGTGTLQYKLDAGSYQVADSFATVAAGQHTILVKDANACVISQGFTIVQPSNATNYYRKKKRRTILDPHHIYIGL